MKIRRCPQLITLLLITFAFTPLHESEAQVRDGTEKTSVIKGRPSGENRMRVRIDAFAEYSEPDPDVDVFCSGVSVYRMRYLFGG